MSTKLIIGLGVGGLALWLLTRKASASSAGLPPLVGQPAERFMGPPPPLVGQPYSGIPYINTPAWDGNGAMTDTGQTPPPLVGQPDELDLIRRQYAAWRAADDAGPAARSDYPLDPYTEVVGTGGG